MGTRAVSRMRNWAVFNHTYEQMKWLSATVF